MYASSSSLSQPCDDEASVMNFVVPAGVTGAHLWKAVKMLPHLVATSLFPSPDFLIWIADADSQLRTFTFTLCPSLLRKIISTIQPPDALSLWI